MITRQMFVFVTNSMRGVCFLILGTLAAIAGCGENEFEQSDENMEGLMKYALVSDDPSDFVASDDRNLPESLVHRVKALQEIHPDARAWFIRDNLDRLLIPPEHAVRSDRWDELWESKLYQVDSDADPTVLTLGGAVPFVSSSVRGDCDHNDKGDSQSICGSETKEARRVFGKDSASLFNRTQVRTLLWDHFASIIDEQNDLFGLTADELRAHHIPIRVRRTKSVFILDIEREIHGIPCAPSLLRIYFDEDGRLLALTGGLIQSNAIGRLESALLKQMSENERERIAIKYIYFESRTTVPVNVLNKTIVYDIR